MSIPRNLATFAPGTNSSGVVQPGFGGTGQTTLTANAVILGNATGSVQTVAPGASGNLLTSDGTTWISQSNVISANTIAISNSAYINSNRTIINYGLTVNALGSGSGSRTIDLTLGNFVTATVTGTTTWTFSNPIASPNACGIILELTDGGSATQNWPSGIKWPGGTAPTLTVSGVDVLVFISDDGGTIWRGVACMLDSK
jgi:hypothetical protein